MNDTYFAWAAGQHGRLQCWPGQQSSMWAQCLNSSRVTRVNKVSWARDPFQICRSIDYWQAVAARDILTSSVGWRSHLDHQVRRGCARPVPVQRTSNTGHIAVGPKGEQKVLFILSLLGTFKTLQYIPAIFWYQCPCLIRHIITAHWPSIRVQSLSYNLCQVCSLAVIAAASALPLLNSVGNVLKAGESFPAQSFVL